MKKRFQLVLAVASAGLVLTGCGGSAGTAAKAGSNSTDLTKGTFFKTIVAAQQKAGSSHLVMTFGFQGQSIKAEGDNKVGKSIADTAASMTMDMSAMGAGSVKLVVVDGVFYLNFGQITDNKFAKIDLKDPNNPFARQYSSFIDQLDPSKQFAQFEGAVKSLDKKGAPMLIDGVQAQHYVLALDTTKIAAFKALTGSAGASIPKTITYSMYMGPDNLVRRMSYQLAGISGRIDFSKWGAPVDIKAQSKDQITTKDLSKLMGGAAKA